MKERALAKLHEPGKSREVQRAPTTGEQRWSPDSRGLTTIDTLRDARCVFPLPTGSNTQIIDWLVYAGREVAHICRSRTGPNTPILKWLEYAGR